MSIARSGGRYICTYVCNNIHVKYVYIYICVCYICIHVHMWCAWMYNRRKFRSQLSDNMDRWKAEVGREEERRSKRESLRRKKIQAREKVGKSRNIMFFQ